MSAPRSDPALVALRQRIAAIEGDHAPPLAALPFGLSELDRRLPKGGLALGCLHEVAGGGNGATDGAAAACFAAGIAARLPGQVLWCVTQAALFAPGLEQAGLPSGRVIHVEAGDDTSVLACMEEGLRHGSLAAVGWPKSLTSACLRQRRRAMPVAPEVLAARCSRREAVIDSRATSATTAARLPWRSPSSMQASTAVSSPAST